MSRPINYAKIGATLFAVFEYGDTVYHVIVDHGQSIIEIVTGE